MEVLLTVRTPSVADGVIASLADLDVHFSAASSLDAVDEILGRLHVDHAILGGGLDLETRLEIVRRLFAASDHTTIHMNSPSGPESYLPFVRSVLAGFGAS